MSELHDTSPLPAGLLGQVCAAAWLDPNFRGLLETDPTAAIKKFCAKNDIPMPARLHPISDRPDGVTDEALIEIVNGQKVSWVHSCC